MNMTYPKINTLFNRDATKKSIIIEGEYSRKEFTSIRRWLFTEKIDGTNIRITYDSATKVITYEGKTDNAQIPAKLYAVLTAIFSPQLFETAFAPADPTKPFPKKITLYGEGYGAGIACDGEPYRPDMSFILFDVTVDGWWLERENVFDIAQKMHIQSVPIVGVGSLEDGIEMVKSKRCSYITVKEKTFEGIVATSDPLMLFRDGTPIKWKLKVKDYRKLDLFNTRQQEPPQKTE
jgi:hypothetical protein